jgi:RimJ/RimL family protein N-acetyltransferase
MIERARAAGVTTVIAHTLAEPNASTRVLANLGFEHTQTIEDPEDGTIWRWERTLD